MFANVCYFFIINAFVKSNLWTFNTSMASSVVISHFCRFVDNWQRQIVWFLLPSTYINDTVSLVHKSLIVLPMNPLQSTWAFTVRLLSRSRLHAIDIPV